MEKLSIAFFFAMCSCVPPSLAPSDRVSLHEAEIMIAKSYEIKEAGTPGGQFERAAYCAVDAVLRRSDAGTLDGPIVCVVKLK